MPTDFTFRLSTYLTLVVVSAAVGYAEFPVLPEVAFIAGGVIVALAVLFWMETRVELLTIPAANRLGLVIMMANFAWATFRIAQEVRDPEMLRVNWQIMGVALFGPLLITSMPAKLARREKHAGDYWFLHFAALVAAALAAALAEDPVCFVLIGFYAAFAVWSLSLFYLRRAGGAIPPVPGKAAAVTAGGVVGGSPRGDLKRAVVLAGVGIACALPLYLITPRSPADKLDLGKPRVEIGYAADQMIDLNQTGDLRPNEQVAFEVTAEENGRPKTDLSGEQRWAGRILRQYQRGVWQAQSGEPRSMPETEQTVGLPFPWFPPRLGPGEITLTFSLPPTFPGHVLADPIVWANRQSSPVATLTPGGPRGWAANGSGSFLSGPRPATNGEPFRYLQVWRPGPEPDRGPAFRLADNNPDAALRLLCNNPLPKVKEYADAVVARLEREGRLPHDYRDPVTAKPRVELHETIARALCDHLATTPELTYTTNLQRNRRELDPVEDFLFHTRAGHCERFATALTLLLRSQNIPAVLILGFKGCEATDVPGHYVVRQEHAHAWVQVLLPVPGQTLEPQLRKGDWCCWLSLDPTPVGGPEAGPGANASWARKVEWWLRSWFHDYFVSYTPEQRQEALVAAATSLTRVEFLGPVAVLVGGFIVVRAARRRKRRPAPTAQRRWFDRLLAVLAAHGFRPAPGQTPREFASEVAHALRRSAPTAAVAEVPLDWAEAYYESRFGGAALPPDRLAALDDGLNQLERALAGGGRP